MFLIKKLCCKEQIILQNQNKRNQIQSIVSVNNQGKSRQNDIKKSNNVAHDNQINDKKQVIYDNLSIPTQQIKQYTSFQQYQSNLVQVGSQLSYSVFDSIQIFNSPNHQSYKSQKQLNFQKIKKLNNLQFIKKQMRIWSVKNVLSFLSQIGLKHYQTIFYQNRVKGKDLSTLKDHELEQDLMMNRNDIKILKLYIRMLKQNYHEQTRKGYNLIRCKSQKKINNCAFSISTSQSSCRKLLTLVQNPILEQSQQDIDESNRTKQIYTSNFSTSNNDDGLLSH